MTRTVLVHAHIFKNAGTTFDFSLRGNFGEAFVDHREDNRFLQDKNSYLLDYLHAHPALQALSSHSLHFRIEGNDGLKLVPVYFLRHPLARVWSVYQFEKQQAGAQTEGARRAKQLDINGYVRWYLEEGSPATIRNIHTIFLSGDGPSPHDMAGKYALARDYLDQGNALFAVVERYDESMLMLEDALAEIFPQLDLAYIKKNVSAGGPTGSLQDRVDELLSTLDSDVAQALVSANDYDLQLYQQAGQLLDARLKAIAGLAAKKEGFGQRCRLLQAGAQ